MGYWESKLLDQLHEEEMIRLRGEYSYHNDMDYSDLDSETREHYENQRDNWNRQHAWKFDKEGKPMSRDYGMRVQMSRIEELSNEPREIQRGNFWEDEDEDELPENNGEL